MRLRNIIRDISKLLFIQVDQNFWGYHLTGRIGGSFFKK